MNHETAVAMAVVLAIIVVVIVYGVILGGLETGEEGFANLTERPEQDDPQFAEFEESSSDVFPVQSGIKTGITKYST